MKEQRKTEFQVVDATIWKEQEPEDRLV